MSNGEFMIIPAGPLMREHRLIEKIVPVMKDELNRLMEEQKINPKIIDVIVDFLRTYADNCHHGKEENILFEELKKKDLSSKHKETMDKLVADHEFARDKTSALLSAKQKGDVKEVINNLRELIELYPVHIETEDKDFFLPCMEYFSEEEQAAMVKDFWKFDRRLIHEKYEQVIDNLKVIS